MAESNISDLKVQFGRMQREITATLALMKKLQGDTVIVGICPDFCAPVRVIDPPRLDDKCEIRIGRIEGAITVHDTEDAIVMLGRWMENMIRVLDEADPNLPLPQV